MYWIIYIAVIYAASLIPLFRWKTLKSSDKIIAVLLVLAAVQQSLSIFGRLSSVDVARIFNVYALIEFLLISLYFNYSLYSFRVRHIGIIAGFAGVALGLINMIFFQKFDAVNTYFMFAEAAAILLYCMVAFLKMPLSENHKPTRFAEFWITVLLLCYASPTLMGWLFIAVTGDNPGSPFQKVFFRLLLVFNFAFYIGIGLVFLMYKKLLHFSEPEVHTTHTG